MCARRTHQGLAIEAAGRSRLRGRGGRDAAQHGQHSRPPALADEACWARSAQTPVPDAHVRVVNAWARRCAIVRGQRMHAEKCVQREPNRRSAQRTERTRRAGGHRPSASRSEIKAGRGGAEDSHPLLPPCYLLSVSPVSPAESHYAVSAPPRPTSVLAHALTTCAQPASRVSCALRPWATSVVVLKVGRCEGEVSPVVTPLYCVCLY